jgi:iron complex transport system substrate-binding protein
MKKVISALGLVFASVSSAFATTYPVTIENCGYKETFTKAPERVVALGQNTVEILLLLGLRTKWLPAHSGRQKCCHHLQKKQ